MRKAVLDTSALLRWWKRCRSTIRHAATPVLATKWARELIATEDTNAIVTPVFLEVIGGSNSGQELELMQAYLRPFECVDHQRILPEDWREAVRMAQRVPPGPPAAGSWRLPDPRDCRSPEI